MELEIGGRKRMLSTVAFCRRVDMGWYGVKVLKELCVGGRDLNKGGSQVTLGQNVLIEVFLGDLFQAKRSFGMPKWKEVWEQLVITFMGVVIFSGFVATSIALGLIAKLVEYFSLSFVVVAIVRIVGMAISLIGAYCAVKFIAKHSNGDPPAQSPPNQEGEGTDDEEGM